MTTEFTPVSTGLRAGDATVPRRGLLPAIAIGNFTIWVALFTPLVISLPATVTRLVPEDKTGALSMVLLIGSICGLLSNPLAGRLSDRTTSRFGMRRPWLLGGMVLGVLGMMLMALAPTMVVVVLGGCLAAFGFAADVTVILALLPEHVPASRRGLVGGAMGVGQAIAVVFGAALGGAFSATPALAYGVPGLIGIVGVVVLCVLLPDRRLAVADRQPLSLKDIATSYWRSPRRYPDFGWAFVSRFLIFMGFSGILNYQVFYLTDQLGYAPAKATSLVTVALGVQVIFVVLSSALSGTISDRVGRRKPFVIGAGVLAILGLLCIAFATSLPLFLVGMAIAGVGQGTYLAVDLALISEVLPDTERDTAKDFGIMSVANQLPQTVSPAIAPVFLGLTFGSVVAGAANNYTAFFLASAVFAAISAFAVTRIRSVR